MSTHTPLTQPEHPAPLGFSGRIAAFFQSAQITPLLALVALALGLFAVLVTPREEEPQINVTMANVMLPFPGASVADVEQMLTSPAEQVLSQMAGVEHVSSVTRPGLGVVTVQFKVGVPRTEALVRLYDAVNSHADWLPAGLGALPPLIKPKGIDDVPIVTFTLTGKSVDKSHAEVGAFDLERVAHSLEAALKRVPGTREVKTLGGPGRAINIRLDAARLAGVGLTVNELQQALQVANAGAPLGEWLSGNHSVALEAGAFFTSADDLAELVVGVRAGKPVQLRDVADIQDGPMQATRYVWHSEGGASRAAVTLSITKKAGENAIDVAQALSARVADLHNSLIPANMQVIETRNYGASANDKATQLIRKLLFATASVVALVFIALGRREAAIVGTAVILTLTVTLFASWAWGFTLNRVSLFALIFSIGILVDDAIVVVENIHRHLALDDAPSAGNWRDHLSRVIPAAVDEVGGPTILATLTVIAALLPMAFVSGLMGPYMSPIPINASMGMLLSLAIAFVLTPWLARLWMKALPAGHGSHQSNPSAHGLGARLGPLFERMFTPLLDPQKGARNRRLLGLGVAGLIVFSLALPMSGGVRLKMLPFDNKSELQVVVDMPAGTPLEQTAATLHALGRYLDGVPEVRHYQAYAGTASPINFNGLVRQYDLRADPHQGDLQVNLVDSHHRKAQSHAIAMRLRPELQKIAKRFNANVKVVEVPPGPPVLAPIVAELYGPEAEGRDALASQVRTVFERTQGIVDVDDSRTAAAPRQVLLIDRRKAAQLGISQASIVSTLRIGMGLEPATWLHDQSKFPSAALLQLPPESQGSLDSLLSLTVRGQAGNAVPLRELTTVSDSLREQPVFHKDLLPVNYVTADMADPTTGLDSPLYGLFKMRSAITALPTPGGGTLQERFISAPNDALRDYSLKWDGEWQITYETFRDMGLAYAVGLVLIYLLVVAQFGSYLTPLIIMAPIPLTLIGVMPGHALMGAQYTATSMIGMIALAGIIVRNSILLVDFIRLQQRSGMPIERAIVSAAATRAQPIILTGLAAMMGAFFILSDPIFNGLAISLIFGIAISTLLTLVVIPLLYFVAYRGSPATGPALPSTPSN
ncbi:efflux RND transporter permease subunit [Roseateles koreensis]|uniref:Efflux RND transporter permease subunit n=1 Tax=Roseateles koreensis TaxID=2987526 RepID=A0ABT5KSE2_9BURK|nr:efflux RND transporter permease subunit [Roseateles koreensis]MDC8785335.1 efflux RND transporter permease subunit [Roseateles koreensis]